MPTRKGEACDGLRDVVPRSSGLVLRHCVSPPRSARRALPRVPHRRPGTRARTVDRNRDGRRSRPGPPDRCSPSQRAVAPAIDRTGAPCSRGTPRSLSASAAGCAIAPAPLGVAACAFAFGFTVGRFFIALMTRILGPRPGQTRHRLRRHLRHRVHGLRVATRGRVHRRYLRHRRRPRVLHARSRSCCSCWYSWKRVAHGREAPRKPTI